MAKDSTKVLKFVPLKIEIGEVTTPGVEPGAFVEVGFVSDSSVTVKMTEATSGVADGGALQGGYTSDIKVEAYEVLNTTVLEGYKNKTVTLKCTPIGTVNAANPIVRVKEFLCNCGLDLALSAKGKNVFLILGKRDVVNQSDLVTYLTV